MELLMSFVQKVDKEMVRMETQVRMIKGLGVSPETV